MKKLRSLILFVPISCLFFLEIYFFYPKSFYYCLVLLFVIISISIFAIAKKAKEPSSKWYIFLILPLFFIFSTVAYTILLSSNFLIQLVFALDVLFLYFYYKNIYYFLIRPKFYRENALENLSSYGNFLIIFFAFSAFFGFQSFLGIKTWILILISAPVIWLVTYQVILTNGILFKNGLIYILLNTVILIELFWSASFLPLNYNGIGLILAICYYMLIGIIRFNLKGKEGEKKIKFYLLFGIISILAIILSSKWL